MEEVRDYNEKYTGEYTSRIAFPIGGLGTGMFCVEGSGAISNMNIRHKTEMLNEPTMFAGLYLKGVDNGSIVVEGQVPDWKKFGQPQSTKGYGGTWGLPRFKDCDFEVKFPFAKLRMSDDELKMDVTMKVWNPFIPTDENNSGLPVAGFEYTFKNKYPEFKQTMQQCRIHCYLIIYIFPLGSCNPIFFSVLSLRCFERALPVHWLCP